MIDPLLRFKALVSAAMVDGVIQPEEEVLLLNVATRCAIPLQTAHALMQKAHQDLEVYPPVPPEPGDRVALFMEIADILAADGVIQEAERNLLLRTAPRFGFRPEQVDRIAQQAISSTRKLLEILKGK